MCRHLAYLGPARTVAWAATHGTHSLARQAWDPQQMRGGGTVNADGFGACWWEAGGGAMGAHRTTLPVWSDPALGGAVEGGAPEDRTADGARGAGAVQGALEQIRATAVVAAVRSATPGMAVSAEACAPFADGRWTFSHNGVVRGWPETVAHLAGRIPAGGLLTAEAPTDSVLLWHLFRARVAAGEDAADAVASVVREVEACAPGSRLNLLVSDGSRVVAAAWRHSLWVCDSADEVLVASEPTGRGRWTEAPDGTLLDARVGSVRARTIPGGPAAPAKGVNAR